MATLEDLQATLRRHGFYSAALVIRSWDITDFDKAIASWDDYPQVMDKYPTTMRYHPSTFNNR